LLQYTEEDTGKATLLVRVGNECGGEGRQGSAPGVNWMERHYKKFEKKKKS
jgi:hypothetical protein